ncbi:hypothetical protein GCM10007301_35960 [Azorhizobium oxalatiphilum]|uniref:NAD-dependent epimerase/dehydratase domain-containing protein n=1 Tax=Azorhizobium oxalatiphilum TaxID=980631 RepID=A0A917FDF9_9HYPH|nr:NAD-dependent epimerase/dehydratase family protein [Azorhizobium oxalatiphilum]GGF72972.1 hypothetical protein GCM10007301_35960 [Azorhizobium oxalatiphilum]
MRLIVRHSPEGDGRHVVAVFGIGLVGGAVIRALRSHEIAPAQDLPLDWRDPARRAADLTQISQGIEALAPHLGPLKALDFVWAAGRAGFAARHEDVEPEIAAFRDVVSWTRDLADALPDTRHTFHMLSSAGGLFEGQRFIDAQSQPRPLRPYGEAKLVQEGIVDDLRTTMVAHVYRPSSVYGFSGPGGRAGLLNTLVDNAKKHAPSRIFGGLDTIRDYVLSSDIGTFIGRRIAQPDDVSRTHLLASGKPASMTQMLRIASKVVGHPLYLKFDVQPSNAGHITYRASALPQDWRPTDLETGIRQVARQLSLSFEAGARRR